MNPEEFRKAGYRGVDWIADYRKNIETRPVMSSVRPGDYSMWITSLHLFEASRRYL